MLKITSLPGNRAVPRIITIVTQHCEIRNITVREPNMDEIFLHLTGTALRD